MQGNVVVIHLQTRSVVSPGRTSNGAMLLLIIIPNLRFLDALHWPSVLHWFGIAVLLKCYVSSAALSASQDVTDRLFFQNQTFKPIKFFFFS